MAEAHADCAPVLATNGDVAEDDHDAEDEEDEEEADEEEVLGAATDTRGGAAAEATEERDDHEGDADVECGPAKGGYANRGVAPHGHGDADAQNPERREEHRESDHPPCFPRTHRPVHKLFSVPPTQPHLSLNLSMQLLVASDRKNVV